MKKKVKNIYNFIVKYFIEFIFLIIMLYYFINCTLYSQDNPNYNVYFLMILIFIIYITLYKLIKKINIEEKWIKLSIVIGSIIIYFIWGFIARTQPISDYEVLINGAKSILNGTFTKLTFNPQNYFYFYNFQIGYTLYLALIMKLFGTSLLSLKIIEILVMSISNLLVYNIVSKIYDKNAALISTLLYSTLLFNIAGSSIINNQHISMLFILLGLYFLIKDEKKISKILSGIFLALSYIVRQSSVIFIIALVCYMIFKVFKNNFKEIKKPIINTCLILITFLSFISLYDFTLVSLKFVPNSAIKANAKYFKYVLGFQSIGITNIPTTTAEKTNVYYDLKEYNFDYDKYNEASKKYIINKYSNETRKVYTNIKNKMIAFTSQPDNQIGYATVDREIISGGVKLIKYYGYAQYIFIIILTSISVIFYFKNKNKCFNDYDVLMKIIFIGYFICHIFIEVQTRYRYDQYVILCILSGPILYKIINYISFKNLNKINHS